MHIGKPGLGIDTQKCMGKVSDCMVLQVDLQLQSQASLHARVIVFNEGLGQVLLLLCFALLLLCFACSWCLSVGIGF